MLHSATGYGRVHALEHRCRVMETSFLRVEFQGESRATTLDDDLLSGVHKRGGGGAHGCLAVVVWSYQQDDRAGGAMTGHDDDDFDSQTRTPITPGLGCYPRSDVRSPSWPCISCTNNALFSAYTFCWRICLFRNMIAAILFPVYVYYLPCSTCRRITCRFTTIPSANINPIVYRSPATWISPACVFSLRTTVRLTIDTARSKLHTKSRYTIFLIFQCRCYLVRKRICFDITRLKRGTDYSIQRYVTFGKK